MTIDETAICQWADRHDCRSNLPILVLSFWGIDGKRFFCKATPA